MRNRRCSAIRHSSLRNTAAYMSSPLCFKMLTSKQVTVYLLQEEWWLLGTKITSSSRSCTGKQQPQKQKVVWRWGICNRLSCFGREKDKMRLCLHSFEDYRTRGRTQKRFLVPLYAAILYHWFQVLLPPNQYFWFKILMETITTQAFQSQNITTSYVVSSQGLLTQLSQSMVGYHKIYAGTSFVLWDSGENANDSRYWVTQSMSVFWHPLDLGKCQLHLSMESNRFITPSLSSQTTRREDYSSLGEDVDEKLSVWSNNRQ